MRKGRAILLLALILVVSACKNSSDRSDIAEASSEPTYVEAPGEGPDSAKFAIGQKVKITEESYEPLQLASVLGSPLVFENTSSAAQTIVFTNGAIDEGGTTTLGPIEPGDKASFEVPTPRSITYRTSGHPDLQGAIQVDVGAKEL